MKTKTINLYSFDELSEEAKQKAIENLYDLNVDHDWWQWTYEDAERVGIKITGFDLERGSYCKGDFLEDAETVAKLILKEHGEQCESYKTALQFMDEKCRLVHRYESEIPEMDQGDFDYDLECLEDEFLKSICEDYRIILQKEYEYLTSEEQIIESIKANEYTFTENGKLCN